MLVVCTMRKASDDTQQAFYAKYPFYLPCLLDVLGTCIVYLSCIDELGSCAEDCIRVCHPTTLASRSFETSPSHSRDKSMDGVGFLELDFYFMRLTFPNSITKIGQSSVHRD